MWSRETNQYQQHVCGNHPENQTPPDTILTHHVPGIGHYRKTLFFAPTLSSFLPPFPPFSFQNNLRQSWITSIMSTTGCRCKVCQQVILNRATDVSHLAVSWITFGNCAFPHIDVSLFFLIRICMSRWKMWFLSWKHIFSACFCWNTAYDEQISVKT